MFFLAYTSEQRNNVRSRAWGAGSGCSYRVEKCCIVKVTNQLSLPFSTSDISNTSFCLEDWMSVQIDGVATSFMDNSSFMDWKDVLFSSKNYSSKNY